MKFARSRPWFAAKRRRQRRKLPTRTPRPNCKPPLAELNRKLFLATAVLLCLAMLFFAGCNRRRSDIGREFVYITNGKSDTVSVIDARTLQVVRTIGVGRNPTGIIASPTRREIYAVNTESNNISFIDADRNVVIATVGVHRAPYFMSVSTDGTRGYVANSGSANVSVLDLQNRKVLANIGVGGKPGL